MDSHKFRIVIVFALLLFGMGHAIAAKSYRIGVFTGLGGTQDIQGAEIMRSFAKVFEKKLGMPSVYRVYAKEEDFVKDIREQKLDMTFSTRWDFLFGPMREAGFRPAITLKIFGKNQLPNCFYVASDSPLKTVKDLRGKNVATYTSETEYTSLRAYLGVSPEDYFSPLSIYPNSMSGLYQLSLGTTDGAYVNQGVFKFMSLTNPGAVKQLREVACGPANYSPPFSMGKGVSPKIEELVVKIMLNAHRDPAFKVIQPLSKGMTANFIRVNWNHYQPLLTQRKRALEQGWLKDHFHWLTEAKNRQQKVNRNL